MTPSAHRSTRWATLVLVAALLGACTGRDPDLGVRDTPTIAGGDAAVLATTTSSTATASTTTATASTTSTATTTTEVATAADAPDAWIAPIDNVFENLLHLGDVIVVGASFEVLGVDPRTGEILWRYEAGDGPPTINFRDGLLYYEDKDACMIIEPRQGDVIASSGLRPEGCPGVDDHYDLVNLLDRVDDHPLSISAQPDGIHIVTGDADLVVSETENAWGPVAIYGQWFYFGIDDDRLVGLHAGSPIDVSLAALGLETRPAVTTLDSGTALGD